MFANPNPSWLVVIGGVTVIAADRAPPRRRRQRQRRALRTSSAARSGASPATAPEERAARPLPDVVREPVEPATLEVSNITVRFGGVVAVNDASVTVDPGEIVGLIGPNGAGKTTLIDAITGFVKPAQGTRPPERRGDRRLARVQARPRTVSAARSSSSSCSRASTVRENLMVASDGYSHLPYVTDIVRPDEPAALRRRRSRR